MPKPSEDYIASNPHGVAPAQIWKARNSHVGRYRRIRVVRKDMLRAMVVPCLEDGRMLRKPRWFIRLDQFRRWERQ